ncbi:MAG: sugar phosphate isomerase/epimerase [Caldilineaceae bacterium]|nr:sugar phosphate isomerase/epimerase [Caldilineaceae bacterium]MCB0144514.1 sugar phosphate isomerase/epimerase [Caldilineaceae bacterium]MCB9156175.1 sugar phosphate isomerase/epimerase [Caldilineaceae bacterium]
MKIGCCSAIENAGLLKEAGFDYIECTVTSLMAEADDQTFAPILQRYQASPLPTPVLNVFLPGDLKVVGPEVDWPRVEKYVNTALARANQIDAGMIVFGSGRSRAIPDGFDRDEAWAQLVRFLQITADAADANDITIVIEPLNTKESNVLNSVAEGVKLAQDVNRTSIRVLADFYHMDEENEPLDDLVQYADWLEHIHVADTGRRAPGTGSYPYTEFVQKLHQSGYDGLVSIECRWEDLAAEAGPAAQFLRRVL